MGGSQNIGNWEEAVILPAAKFADSKAGDKMLVEFTVNAGKDYGQLWFCDSEWQNLEATTNSATNVGKQYPTYSPGTVSSTFTLAATDMDAIKTGGVILKGYELTITKVWLLPGNGHGQDPTDPTPGEGETVIFTGSNNFETWKNALEFKANVCKGLKAGDEVVVYFSVNAGKEYGQVRISSADWEIMKDTTDKTGTNRNDWSCYDPDKTTTTFTIDAADIDGITSEGFILSGENVTVTKVTLKSNSSSSVETIETDADAPAEYYTLQGVKVANPTAGSIVICRKNSKVSKMIIR